MARPRVLSNSQEPSLRSRSSTTLKPSASMCRERTSWTWEGSTRSEATVAVLMTGLLRVGVAGGLPQVDANTGPAPAPRPPRAPGRALQAGSVGEAAAERHALLGGAQRGDHRAVAPALLRRVHGHVGAAQQGALGLLEPDVRGDVGAQGGDPD